MLTSLCEANTLEWRKVTKACELFTPSVGANFQILLSQRASYNNSVCAETGVHVDKRLLKTQWSPGRKTTNLENSRITETKKR